MADLSQTLREQVLSAIESQQALQIRGSGSKDFLGETTQGNILDLTGHRGIIHYEPTELVLTARAGTPLKEIEAALAEQGQMLPFEPPHYGDNSTLGGTIACNLSGPRRAFTGAARDLVLGVTIINGQGEILRFGGEVMKNVAGYDASRLMAGAFGTLGVLLDISLKVLPRPETEITLLKDLSAGKAQAAMNRWCNRDLPMSAAAFDGQHMAIRLSGSPRAVEAAQKKVGGDPHSDSDAYWHRIREQQHGFFQTSKPLWRLSVPPAAPLDGEENMLLDWGGAQRWLKSDASAEVIRGRASRLRGHATLYRGTTNASRFQPLAPGMLALQQRLKKAFDPHGIFNPGRLYKGL